MGSTPIENIAAPARPGRSFAALADLFTVGMWRSLHGRMSRSSSRYALRFRLAGDPPRRCYCLRVDDDPLAIRNVNATPSGRIYSGRRQVYDLLGSERTIENTAHSPRTMAFRSVSGLVVIHSSAGDR